MGEPPSSHWDFSYQNPQNKGRPLLWGVLTMVGCKEYHSLEEAIQEMVHFQEEIHPNSKGVVYYESKHQTFATLYALRKDIFAKE